MFRKFIDGLVFGSGFAIAFLVVAYVVVNIAFRLGTPLVGNPGQDIVLPPVTPALKVEPEIPFHELSIDDQIKASSVIAMAKYKKSSEGRIHAVITEFLKKDPATTIYYKIGDEYPDASYYPSDGAVRGEGAIIFFVGSPASMRMSVSYDGDRIHGLGDIPIELFKQKCDKSVS